MPMHKIVIARWLEELARVKFEDGRVSLVPNSVDLTQFNAPPRERQQIPTVGMLYSKSKLKGCVTSFAALERVASELPSLRLICFGMDHPGPIALRIPRYGEFHFCPPQDEIRKLYAKCDVWICGGVAAKASV